MTATAQWHEGIFAALAFVAFGGLILLLVFWPKAKDSQFANGEWNGKKSDELGV